MNIVYDLETYPNLFLFGAVFPDSGISMQWEVSDWQDESREIVRFCNLLDSGDAMIGFNNAGFDYPVLHAFLQSGGRLSPDAIAKLASDLIACQDFDPWRYYVRPSDRRVRQIDLFKIHHFDNLAKRTSLKMIEFAQGASIQTLPIKPGTRLTADQADEMRRYNMHDVRQTAQFWFDSKDKIVLRQALADRYPGQDSINFNDTKLGKQYFITRLEKAGVQLYDYGKQGRTVRQTLRNDIHIKDAVFPFLSFNTPAFQHVLDWMRKQVIFDTVGVFKGVVATVDGLDFHFGLGGIHASRERRVFRATDSETIIDIDASSFYPQIAIQYGLYPAHLGPEFCKIYKELYDERKKYPKKSPPSEMLKLGLNGTFGESNQVNSPFFDSLFTMSITLNGQFLLCVLVEWLLGVDGLTVIQANTDGVTVSAPRASIDRVKQIMMAWQSWTRIPLESVEYRAMWIRDVNNYIAQSVSGEIKRKGAYEYNLDWHKDWSGLVVAKAAEQVLVHGKSMRDALSEFLSSSANPNDFAIRAKCQRNSTLMHGSTPIQNPSRFFVSRSGQGLTKIMPGRTSSICSGYLTTIANEGMPSNWRDLIDLGFYESEIEKLTLVLK